ncbi:hypothetical protein CSV86_013485 [Pseudomonas putida CSV86]|uniref:Uncharacterized protein n=2 Tax=Pseudomonas TaxID=286 RepID=A0A7K4EET0_9PSED|nr:hypothetical protein [Pseudomonas bharatica]NNJ16164.1 hypothetical protein [Pseudomonas bharatica CSV86]
MALDVTGVDNRAGEIASVSTLTVNAAAWTTAAAVALSPTLPCN